MSNCEKPGNWKSLSVRGPVDSLQRGLAPGIGRVYDKNVGIANRFNGTWSLLPKGHKGPLFHPRMIHPVVGGGGWTRGQSGVSQRAHAGFLRSRPPGTPPPPPRHRRDGIAWERGRPARILSLWPRLSFSAMLQAAHPVGGNRIGQAEGEPWRRSRLNPVGEMAEAVPGLVRAGRPRSREAVIP